MPRRPEEGTRNPGAGVRGSCELLMSALGSEQVFRKSRTSS